LEKITDTLTLLSEELDSGGSISLFQNLEKEVPLNSEMLEHQYGEILLLYIVQPLDRKYSIHFYVETRIFLVKNWHCDRLKKF
jgi:hypothetical protein